jgi:DNA-binding SARP family transcriptional activator/TolB-like protein
VRTAPLIEFRLLGSLSVRTEAGHEAGAVLAQPKRLALLAYLAAATPQGFHRRDTLLALFWPEADQEHAQTSLRKALHFLRRELGPGVVVGRGDEEVGVQRDRCWCDAVAFVDAVDAGRSEQALSLYQGDFLAGFHVSDAPEFERWLDGERARLRDLAARAAWSLAGKEEAKAGVSAAVPWARRAADLSPYDETGIRRLVSLLDRAGDRAGAVVTYEQFAQRLAADLDLEPSSETMALVEAVRSRNGLASSRHRGASETGEPRAAAVVPGPHSAEAPSVASPAAPWQGLRRRLRSGRVSLGLMAVSATGAIGAIVSNARSTHQPPASPTAIAVLPFDYRGNPEFSYLAEGMVELLSTKLEGAAGFRSIDPHALLGFVSRDHGSADPRRGRLAAEHFGAGRFVLGSIVEAGGRLQASATIYDSGGRPQSSVEASAGGEADALDMADRLAQHILAKAQDTHLDLARVADQTTSSLPALKAYIEGERELRVGQTGPASEAFERAIELDTAFALAYYRLGMLTRDGPLARQRLDRALRHSDRLGEHQRRLMEAQAALLRGEHTLAEQRYRQVVADHPDDVEAWSMLGLLISGRANLLGRAWVDAREAYERVLALDPQNGLALWTLATIAARDDRRAALDSLTNRFLQLRPDPEYAGDIRGQRAIVLGDAAGLERFVADLRTRPDESAQTGAGLVTYTTMNLAVGRRLWRLIADPSRSPGMRVLAHVTLAKIELTSGRWRAASSELDRAGAVDAGSAIEHRAFFALTRFLQTPRAELLVLRDSLQRWHAGKAGPEGDGLLGIHRAVHPYLRRYLLGMLSARLGDASAAQRYAAELERVDSSSAEGAFAVDEARLVRTEVAWGRDRPQEALTTLEQARFWTAHSEIDETGDSPFFTHMHERFARAELLFELGRYEEALPWYRGFAYDFLYTAPAHFRLAQIYQAKGDRRQAIEHYTRFIELWRDADPVLRPKVAEAEAALVRLR